MVPPSEPPERIIFWDMAGTLLSAVDGERRIQSMPGSEPALATLQKDHTLLVATGDFAATARLMLREAGLLQYFKDIYGNMWAPAGKPYGEILAEWKVPPENCLAIGDRVAYDIPADSSRLVTLIVNQNGFTLHADAIVAMVSWLHENGDNFFEAFHALLDRPEPATEAAWYHHPTLDEPRPIIHLPG